jgi:predicted outer membrane protein
MKNSMTMQALVGIFALGLGTAMAAPETARPVDPSQPARPGAIGGAATGTTGTTGTKGTGTTGAGPGTTAPGTAGTDTTTGNPHGNMGVPPSAPAGTTASTLSPAESKSAKRILTDIHNVNALEITLGRLAQQKAESQTIKDYAQQLITDHESADRKVLDFANTNNILLTANMPATAAPGTTASDAGTRTGTMGTTGTGTTAGANPAATTGNTPATAGTTPGAASDAGRASDASLTELDAAGRRAVTKLEKLEGAKFEKAFLTEMVKGHSKTLGKLKGAEKQAKNTELKTLLGDLRTSVQMHLDRAKELQRGGSASLDSAQPARPL